MFVPLPGCHDIIEHSDPLTVFMHGQPYLLPKNKRKLFQEELSKILEMRVIEESHIDWNSPLCVYPDSIVLCGFPKGECNFKI